MNILVINTGSSSIKYQLFDMESRSALASGLAEKIGEATGRLTCETVSAEGERALRTSDQPIADHREGLAMIVDLLLDPVRGVIHDKAEIGAVGHRVVHGGETFKSTTVVDADVLAAIRKNIPLAPLHNPPNLTGIEVACSIFPDSPQVAVFDTAFHQTIPPKAFLYALPYALYQREGVRRYGFHGTSHAYVAEQCARHLGRPLEALNLITAHLGNGASMAAIKKGSCIDTTMGMTPLEGLVMGTRAGDLDPGVVSFLADTLKMSMGEIDRLLNKESGLKGICGANDMREVYRKTLAGDERSALAIEVYCYRIRKYIGAYFAALGTLDALVFTAGIGENFPTVRMLSCQGLDGLGIEIDAEVNDGSGGGVREIGRRGGDVCVLVIPTNEELKIADETERLIQSLRRNKLDGGKESGRDEDQSEASSQPGKTEEERYGHQL